MITPVVYEPVWDEALRDIPSWQPPLVPTVVIAPHPDDETLAAGGLIASLRESGIPVSVVAVTDGENAYKGDFGLGPVREVEQARALHRLGVTTQQIHRLHLPDSGVSEHESQLVHALEPLLREAHHIVAPWPHDFHPDHEVTGRAALVIAQRYSIPLTFYFFWTWHRGTPELLQSLHLRRFQLTSIQQQAKREALAFHVSQLHHHSGAPILPADLLLPAFRPYEIFLLA